MELPEAQWQAPFFLLMHIHGQGQDKVIDMGRYEGRSFDKKEAYPIVSKDDTFFIFFTSSTFLMVNKNVSSN